MYRFLLLFWAMVLYGQNSCTECHKGIESIRDPRSGMMKAIYEVAQKANQPRNDCIVCHGGNPNATTKELAHSSTVAYFKTHKGPQGVLQRSRQPVHQ